ARTDQSSAAGAQTGHVSRETSIRETCLVLAGVANSTLCVAELPSQCRPPPQRSLVSGRGTRSRLHCLGEVGDRLALASEARAPRVHPGDNRPSVRRTGGALGGQGRDLAARAQLPDARPHETNANEGGAYGGNEPAVPGRRSPRKRAADPALEARARGRCQRI